MGDDIKLVQHGQSPATGCRSTRRIFDSEANSEANSSEKRCLAYNVRRRHESPGRGQICSNLVDGAAVGGSGFLLNRGPQSSTSNRSSVYYYKKIGLGSGRHGKQADHGQAPVTPILRDHHRRDQDGLRIIKHTQCRGSLRGR